MARQRLGAELSRAAQLMQGGRPDEAAAICRQVLKRDKRDADAHQMLGLIASMVGRFDEAATCFQRGLRISPRAPMLLCGLAKARTSQGRYDEAIAAYDKALAAEPGYSPAISGKADTLERRGAFDEARAMLEPVIAAGEENAESAFIFATLQQRDGRDEDAVVLIERHLADPALSEITKQKLLYCAGKSYDKLKQHDRAFDAYRRANAIFAQPYSIETTRRKFDRVMQVFSRENIPRLACSSSGSELPIFVVSMPRSGSTLVEQILDAHPEAHGAGEIDELPQRVRELARETGAAGAAIGYPESVERMDRAAADRLAQRYLGRVRPLDRSARRIVDKHLQNFQYIGLISRLFPKARVIYCRRDPMAVCFSCYMMPLSPVALPYTTDLRNLGLFFREYERLMQFWMDTLDFPILEVRYEELVADQDRVSREIVDFAGLAWDDACLRFYDTKRDVATASYDQVRRPIYKAAVNRYAPYEAHMEPLRAALAGEPA